jgi:hypothetical protein
MIAPESLRVVGGDTVEPHPGGIIKAFARIGYKLPEAVADIVDNSVDAGAKNVVVRFFCTDQAIRRVAIVDDGHGMLDAKLLHAMQFGTDVKHASTDLGKFGIGMKSASFSQARCLSVISMSGGQVAARRWTVDSIRLGWRCERLHEDDAGAMLAQDWGDAKIKKHGTVVVWDELDKLQVAPGGVEPALRRLFNQLRLALGIVYHRFLEREDISIKLDSVQYGEPAGIAQPVLPINPFGYEKSGDKHYPKTFKLKIGKSELQLQAHIWPPRAKGNEYSLGGSAAARQGFYFYRNDRLIQVGGWNRLRDHETDPHLTLARAAIDLPASLDSIFSLDVQKSGLDVPPGFDVAVKEARSGGVSWADYLKDADRVYRRGEDAAPENAPIVMGGGVPQIVRTKVTKVLGQGEKRQRKIKFKWAKLAPDVFFDVDRSNHLIRLNELYRKAITAGGKSSQDGAMVKTLLFLLLREEFNRERVRQDAREWLDNCNKMLIAAVTKPET